MAETEDTSGSGMLDRPIPPIVPILLVAAFVGWLVQSDALRRPGLPQAKATTKTGAKLARVLDLEFSPDGSVLAVARADGTLQLLESATGKPVFEERVLQGPLRAVGFFPDGARIALAGAGAHVLDRATAVATPLEGGTVSLSVIRVSPDGKRIAAAGQDLRTWDAATGKLEKRHEMEDLFTSIALSPDVRTLVTHHNSAVNFGIAVRSTETGKKLGNQPSGSYSLDQLVFSADGSLLAGGTFKGVEMWRMPGAQSAQPLGPLPARVQSIAFSKDASRAVLAGEDSTLRLWDVRGNRELARLGTGTLFVLLVAWSGTSDLVAAVDELNQVRFYSAGNQLVERR